LAFFLVAATILSVLPQHYVLLKNRSSEGLSAITLGLTNFNGFSGIVNAVLLKFPQLEACHKVGFVGCSPSILSLYQIIALWLFSFPIFLWYLMFFEEDDDNEEKKKEWLWSRVMFFAFIVFAVLCMVISFALLATFGACGIYVRQFGWFMGLLSTILNFFQWAPQIYKTYTTKSKGSFSLIMLLIQAPGSFILVYFFIFVSKENISVWFSTLSAGIQQFILLALILRYDHWAKKKTVNRRDDEETQRLVNPTKSSKKNSFYCKTCKNPFRNCLYACSNCKYSKRKSATI